MNDGILFELFPSSGTKKTSGKGRIVGVPNSGGYYITNKTSGERIFVPVLIHAVKILFKDSKKDNYLTIYYRIQNRLTYYSRHSKLQKSTTEYDGYIFERVNPTSKASLVESVRNRISW